MPLSLTNFKFRGLSFTLPSADGTAGQSLRTNGAKGLSFSSLTKSDVGLSNVDNTSDANKPVSTATQTELNKLSSGSVGLTVDGGGSVITTGQKGYIEVTYDATITRWTIIGNATGSCVIDMWKAAYAGAPPTVANTITGSAKPTLTAAQKAQSSTLTGWTTAITAGDIIGFNIDSVSTLTRLNLSVKITKL